MNFMQDQNKQTGNQFEIKIKGISSSSRKNSFSRYFKNLNLSSMQNSYNNTNLNTLNNN